MNEVAKTHPHNELYPHTHYEPRFRTQKFNNVYPQYPLTGYRTAPRANHGQDNYLRAAYRSNRNYRYVSRYPTTHTYFNYYNRY